MKRLMEVLSKILIIGGILWIGEGLYAHQMMDVSVGIIWILGGLL